MKRIVSTKYRDGARGQPCKLRIAGICTGGGEDTVFAHIRDRHTGRSQKASDISGADACMACHDRFDGRNGLLSDGDWHFYALRGLQETLEDRIARGMLFVTQDTHREPKPRARKPKAQRKPVAAGRPLESRPTDWPSRKFPLSRKVSP